MSADAYDALGIIRTNELLKADEYYGVIQLWGTEVDFGFSKTQEQSFERWDMNAYSTMLCWLSGVNGQGDRFYFCWRHHDGHGQHQVSGEIAQEVFKAAGDPKIFPEQLKDGLQPWHPLAVYSMVPFAPIKDGKMFDYATGKWAPARFRNYVTGEWSASAPSADVTMQVGNLTLAGRSYMQIAREDGRAEDAEWRRESRAERPSTTSYHLWAVTTEAAGAPGTASRNEDLFHNRKVNIDTSVAGLARLAKDNPPAWLSTGCTS